MINENDSYYRMLAEIEDYAILRLDLKGTIMNWNKGAEKIKGYKAEEIIGKNFSLFYTDEDRKKGFPGNLIERAIREGKAIDEGWRLKKDGTLFWDSILITAIHDESGKVIGFSKVTRDLTKSRGAEQLQISLERTQQGLLEVFNASPSGMIITDIESRKYVEVNNNFLTTFGYTREEAIGLTADELGVVTIASRAKLADTLKNQGYLKNENVLCITKWGKEIHCIVSVDLLEIDGKKHFLSVFHDITERIKGEQTERALFQAQQGLLKIFNVTSSGMIIADFKSGQMLEVNKSFLVKFGYTREEAVGRTADELGFVTREIQERTFGKLKQQGYLKNEDVPCITKEGKKIDTVFSVELFELDGKKCFLCIYHDITQIRENEKLIKHLNIGLTKSLSEQEFANKELAFQNIEKEKLTTELKIANKELAFQNIEKEKRAEELVFANKELVFQNEERGRRAADLIIANKELIFQNKEKEKRTAELKIANKELAFQNAEKERLSAELQKSLKEASVYKHAVENSLIVSVTDEKGIIKYVNDNFCKITKYSREELIGQDHIILNSGFHSKELMGDLWLIITDGKIWKGELRNKAKDGTMFWVDTTIVPFLNEHGIPYQYVAIRADITELKAAGELAIANKELAFQNAEKEKLSKKLMSMNKELESKNLENEKHTKQLETVNNELESFSYSVSHDLRAPLRAIGGYAKILEEDYAEKLDVDGNVILHSIMENSERMGDLIDDLLAFSRLGRKEITILDINMNDLVKSVNEELSSIDNAKKTKFKISALPSTKGDQTLIRQVWVNLISNAIKYSKYKPKPVVEIGASKKDGFIIYYVKDNGAGFDMQYYDKLFGVFQRLHTQDEFEGTGIGLAIVQKIVQRHHGKVWAESKLNEGTCFYFSLPDIKS